MSKKFKPRDLNFNMYFETNTAKAKGRPRFSVLSRGKRFMFFSQDGANTFAETFGGTVFYLGKYKKNSFPGNFPYERYKHVGRKTARNEMPAGKAAF